MEKINLNELTLDNIGQWPPIIKAAFIFICSVIIFISGYFLLIKGNFENYDSLKEAEAALRTQFELKQHQASNLQAYRDQLVAMQERFGKMLKQLPTQNEMPSLLEDISKTGVASGLTFELFAPAPEVIHDFYIELPIKIAVKGNYQHLAIFLSRIAQMSRIVTLHDFVIEEPSQDDKKAQALEKKENSNPGELLLMKMTAKIYRYRTK